MSTTTASNPIAAIEKGDSWLPMVVIDVDRPSLGRPGRCGAGGTHCQSLLSEVAADLPLQATKTKAS